MWGVTGYNNLEDIFYSPRSFYHQLLAMFYFCLCNQVLSLLTMN